MSEPIVYLDCSDVRPGRLDELKSALHELAGFVEASVPRSIAYRVYFSEDATRMTVFQLHPDSASLEHHLAVGGERFRSFAALLTLRRIDVYGAPSDRLLEMLRNKARMLGDAAVNVHAFHVGFARLEGVIPVRVRHPPAGS